LVTQSEKFCRRLRLSGDPSGIPGSVADGRVDLDGLHLVGELEITVGYPALDVRGPRDQRVPVPEANGLAVPARNLGTQMRYRAALVELPPDVDLRDEVVGG